MGENFTVSYENEIAKITLSGKLDATNAPAFSDELKKIITNPIKRMVFFADKLTYISSAGLRVIIFAKQKVGDDSNIYFIGASDEVLDVIKMTGLSDFLVIQDSYED